AETTKLETMVHQLGKLHRLRPPDSRRNLRLAGEQRTRVVADFTSRHAGSQTGAYDGPDGRSRDGHRPDPEFVEGFYDMDMCKSARTPASQRYRHAWTRGHRTELSVWRLLLGVFLPDHENGRLHRKQLRRNSLHIVECNRIVEAFQ